MNIQLSQLAVVVWVNPRGMGEIFVMRNWWEINRPLMDHRFCAGITMIVIVKTYLPAYKIYKIYKAEFESEQLKCNFKARLTKQVKLFGTGVWVCTGLYIYIYTCIYTFRYCMIQYISWWILLIYIYIHIYIYMYCIIGAITSITIVFLYNISMIYIYIHVWFIAII